MPSKLNIVVKIPPSNFPDGSYMTIIPDPVNPSLAPLFAGSIGYVSGVSTIENVNVDAGSYLNGYAIDNLATHLNGAVITATTVALPDTNAPTFSLSPNQTSYTITEGDAFFAPTLTLTDDVDGSSTPSPTSNNVDTSTAGNYEITWSGLSDSAGNVIEDVTVSVVVEAVSSKVLIRLLQTANSHYSLSNPVLFSGDFEIAISFSTLDNSGTLLSGSKQSTDIIVMDVFFGELRAFCFVGTSLQTILTSTVDVNNGKLNRAKLRYIGNTAYLYLNNTVVDSSTWSLNGVQDIKLFGKRSGSNSLQGITADVELTDITTPANSLEFKLNKLTGGFELPANNVFGSELYNFSNVGKTGDGNVTSTGVSNFDVEITNTSDRRSYVNFDTVIGQLYQVTLDVDSSAWFIRAGSNGSGNVLVSANSATPFGTQFFTAETTTTSVMLESIGVLGTYSHSNMSMQSISNLVTYENIPEDARETFTVDGTKLIGSNNLVTNGDFAVNDDWNLQNDWSISAGKLRKVNNGSDNRSYQSGVIEDNLDYRFGFDLDVNSGGLHGDTGLGQADIGFDITTSGNYSFDLTTTGTNALSIKGTSEFDGSVDNVFTYRIIDIAVQYTPPPLFDSSGVLTCSGKLSCSETIPSGE
jgi:hypothetical protein